MFHARDDWTRGAPVAVFAAPAGAGAFGKRREPFTLVVDLGADLLTPRWWRGAATLMLLCGAAGTVAPILEPLNVAPPAPLADRELVQAEALVITPLSAGSRTGLNLAPGGNVAPLDHAPQRPRVEMFMTLGPADRLEQLLLRAGASSTDAVAAAVLMRSAGDRVEAGATVAVSLGARSAAGRIIEKVTLKAGLGVTLIVERNASGLALVRQAAPVDSTPLRIRGRVGDGFYWSLRAAGVSPQAAAEYLKAVGSRLDVGGDVASNDRFDLIIANRRAATGESRAGPLLYAGLDRAQGGDVQLMRWTAAGRTDWFDANSDGGADQSHGLSAPVAGPITSGFGYRVHPILRFKRFHRGIDFGAGSGSPIVAAADGRVVRAGWAGGYGRQVRLAHGDGVVTSYSHMSRIVADPGSIVRQGQLIGYVGSSGLSTGPHLHYEVYRGGVAVNPLSVRFTTRAPLDPAALGAFKARLKALLSVGA